MMPATIPPQAQPAHRFLGPFSFPRADIIDRPEGYAAIIRSANQGQSMPAGCRVSGHLLAQMKTHVSLCAGRKTGGDETTGFEGRLALFSGFTRFVGCGGR
jgi:hypothetical protein